MDARKEATEIYTSFMFAENADLSKEGLKSICEIHINKILDMTKRNIVVNEPMYGAPNKIVGVQYDSYFLKVKEFLIKLTE